MKVLIKLGMFFCGLVLAGQAGAANILVRARGISGQESVSLQAGGSTLQVWTLTTIMQNRMVTTSLTRLNFTNDGTNRGVQVDYIQVDGLTRQAEAQTANSGGNYNLLPCKPGLLTAN